MHLSAWLFVQGSRHEQRYSPLVFVERAQNGTHVPSLGDHGTKSTKEPFFIHLFIYLFNCFINFEPPIV